MESKTTIITKLHALQSEVGAITKNATNPFFKSKYFDINGLIEHIHPLLEKHGIVIMQPLTHIGGKPAIRTIVADKASDERIEDVTPLPMIDDPQKMGAAITYYRRYALQSFLLLGAEDDDGNSAKPEKPTAEQLKEVEKLQFLLGVKDAKKPSTAQQADQWIKAYNKKLEEK